MTDGTYQQFSRLRRYVWPIHGHEARKLIPMLLMAFFIGFAFNILRNVKDSLLITAPGSGAEVLPFVKVWAMLPLAILATALFVKLSRKYSTEKVFYGVLLTFMSFYLIFALILYPLRDVIHPHATADYLQGVLPHGLKGFIAMFRYWSFALFYAMSELWGSVILSVLFWGLVNEVTKVGEAIRFYGLLGIGTNCASIASGQISTWLCRRPFNPSWPIGVDAWHQSLILLTFCVIGAGALVMLIFRWFTQNVVNPSDISHNHKAIEKMKKKSSLGKSFSFLSGSRYLLSIGVIVFAYNIFINLVEVLWKDQVKLLHPNPADFNAYMGQITSITGILATSMAIFGSGNIIRKCGWTFAALVTPVILLITSIGFFAFYFFSDTKLGALAIIAGVTPTAMVVIFGTIQNILSRASKYTIFDATKELTFIPLDRDTRNKGKAAIDGVGSRLGKSGGSVIYQGLLMVFNNLSATAPYVAVFLLFILTGWIASARSLGRQFARLTKPAEVPSADPVRESAATYATEKQAV